ncbi:alpha/beta fold hydrolase, partial [Candidatus Woesearchaeota archaeon]|nr:alpha/beta fold hydrolase [Candidatus Woesearchaeota archaeon]
GWGINRRFDLNFSIPLIGGVLEKNIWYEEDDNDTIVYRIDNTIHNYAEINMTNVTIFDKDLGYNKTINLTINETFTYTLNITINKSMNASIFLFSYGNAIHNNTKYYSNRPRILIPQIPEEALVPDCPACPSCGGGGTCPTCPTPECPDIECPALPPLVELCQSCPKEACPSLDCDKCEKKKVSEKIDVVDVISCSEEFLIEEQELEIEDLRDLVDIPEGYELVTQPFRATCSGGESFKTNILSGGNYEDVTVMKCTGGACESDTAIYRRTICGDENNETFKMIDEYNYSSDLAPFTFKQVNLTGDERIIRTGEYKVEIGVDINITLSQITTRILDPENENIKIVGSILNLSYAGEGVEQANVTMPYVLIPGIQEDGIAIYAFVDRDGQRGWKYVGGVVDKEKKVITATIDLAAYAHNGDVILVPMTLYCKDCEGSEFNNHHTPTSDTRRAVVLVHGLWSSNDVWDKLINDFKLSNQPFQVWTYSYDETKTLDETAQDFIDSLEANAYRYDSVYMVGYSLGGYVVQAGLDKAYKENIQESGSYLFLQSVEKVVLLGTPSDGTPMIDHMDSWVSELINTESTTMLPMNPQVRDVLRQGVDYEPIYGIDYYSIAGTKPYDFMEKLGFTETVFDGEVNDGFVSVSSAQKLGMSTLDEECVNFWARPVEHTKLNDDPLVYELLGQIVTLDLAEELLASGIDVPLIGFSNNIEVTIEDCSPDDLYFLVGKKIDRLEKTIYCACGNGVCDGLENSQTCPEDCVSKEQVIEERPVTLAYLIAFISLLLLLLFILLLFLYYKKKHLVLYQGDKFKIKADFVSPIPIASMRFVIAAPPGIHVEPKELKDIPANRKVRVITKGQVDWDMPPNRYKAFSKAILTTKEELAKPFHLRILEREKEPKAPEKLPKDIWLHNRRIALRHIRRTIVELKITAIQIKQDVMRRRIEARSKLHRIGKQKQKLEYKKKRIILEIHRRTQLRKIKHQAKDTEKMIGKLGKKQKSAEKELVKTKDKKGKVQIRHVQKKVRELEHQRDYLKHRDEIIREQYQKRIDSLRNSELKRQGVKVYLSVWRKKR